METLVAGYTASVGSLVWEKSLLYCARPIMIAARTNDRHAMAVNHIADAVREFTCFNSCRN